MAHIPLKPLVGDDEKEIPGFSVCDIESAAGWINFLVIGLCWKLYEKEDDYRIPIEKVYHAFQNLSEFCELVFEEEQPHDIIYAHFGGRYDFSFILKEYFFMNEQYHIHRMIPRGSGLLCFSISKIKKAHYPHESDDKNFGKTKDGLCLVAERTIEFRDSSAMLPFGLGSLTESFGVEHKKQQIDYDKIKEVTPELLEYLEYDCWGLYECIEKYFRWPMIRSCGPAMTAASQAIKVFRTHMKAPISSLSKEADQFVRASYFGGRTEIFKPYFQQHKDDGMLKSFDVNSLYPYIMRLLEFPTKFKAETLFYKPDEMGFYDVEVEVPEMYIPPLGVRFKAMEGRLIFPTGTFRGIWSTHELNYAMTCGVKLKRIFRGMLFHSGGHIFKSYIDFLYDMRKKAGRGSVDNILCKLLMNALYGRFGLNLLREQLSFDRGQLGVEPFLEIPLDDKGYEIIRLVKEEIVLDKSFSNVAIAAWVTSGARVHMHKLIQEAPQDMYYMDTDSLKTTHSYKQNDDDLGELKLEYKAKQGIFLLPKTYMEETTSPIFQAFDYLGKTSDLKSSKKLVMKGFDKKKISKFTSEDFTSALEGDMKRLLALNPKKFAPLRTAISKGKFLALLEEAPRQIRTRYNKRKIIKRPWSQVYDTEPLHVMGDKVLNMDIKMKKWKAPNVEQHNAAYFEKLQERVEQTAEEYHRSKNEDL